MIKFFIIFIFFLFPIIVQALEIEKFQARPDQVLVLYNKDWIKDTDSSVSGQDSKEVAEYYVKRHTDSDRKLKPYILGLTCKHQQKHLNHWYIKEKSQDNKNGILFKGKGLSPGAKEWARDSRHVEIVVKNKDGNADWDSARFWCSSLLSKKKVRVTPLVSGVPKKQGKKWIFPSVKQEQGRCFRFNAHKLFPGTVTVYFELKDTDGNKIRDLKLRYYDRDDFEFSTRGRDGIVDEKYFQEDVAISVKHFLEDPENALSDGTPLKDHILYIVICHGLPISCEAAFGIERGATEKSGGHGDLGSLEQRLQTLYYGWGTKIRPPVISMYMIGGPDSKSGVRNHRITTAMRFPMGGRRWNVYMHPDAYSYLRVKKEPIKDYDIQPFPKVRNISPFFFGYGASRVDGQGPEEAKRQIDYAIYASKYLRPEMVKVHDPARVTARKNSDRKLKIKDIFNGSVWGMPEIPALGFEKKPGQRGQGIPFLKFKQNQSPERFVYMPGGMDRVVDSANGWNTNREAPIWNQVQKGVTITACGGPAYGGGPHITNTTFWDNRILMRYLFRGRDLGECFLLSNYYVNWSTSLIGDPLYHPDLSKTIPDLRPPTISSKDSIQVDVVPTMGKYAAIISCPVQYDETNPEVVLLEARFVKVGENEEKSVFSSIFSARPKVVLRRLAAGCTYQVRLLLTDPYGNKTDLSETFGFITIDTNRFKNQKAAWQSIQKKMDKWVIPHEYTRRLDDKGSIRIEFEAGVNGLLPSIVSKGIYFKSIIRGSKKKSKVSFRLGGVERRRILASPLQEGEKATMLVRWRRYPLTREVLLEDVNGKKFLLISDVRTPWEKMDNSGSVKILEDKGVNIISASAIADSDAFSEKAIGI